MSDIKLRKQALLTEEIFHEGGAIADLPLRRVAMVSVIENPFAGRYEADITGFMKTLEPLGLSMAQRMIEVLGGDPSVVEGYGKGSIVGAGGELEHGALWHVPGGYAMRETLDNAKAIVPSTKKVGGVGTRLDVPITHINASYVRSHFDAMEVGIHDAPRANELALILVMTTGGRIHARVGGLAKEDISAHDGLR
ncbi:amino acid synthesis family protein [Pararhodobacter oceanensis]|uniref:amino acid synthesis family protein n=1 Tax=Pararhodobacter oceanensis TaxID=2172121 RepID=UPI003A8F00FF